MPDFPNPAVASSMLAGSQEADPLIQLLTTTYGMDPAKAEAYAAEITAGRAQGAGAYTAEADAVATRRAEERAAEFKTYSELYKMRMAGEALSPQGEAFMQKVAAEHRARMNQDAVKLEEQAKGKMQNYFAGFGGLTHAKSGASKAIAAPGTKPPAPPPEAPAFNGATALKALGYDEAARRVDPAAPRAIVLSRDPSRVSGQGLDPVVSAPNLPAPPAQPSMGVEAAEQLLRALGIGQ